MNSIQIFVPASFQVQLGKEQVGNPILLRKVYRMKLSIRLAIVSILIASPSWVLAQEGGGQYNHATFGIYTDYFRFSPTSANTTNFVGFGARAGFKTTHHVQLESEMNY